MVEIKKQAEFLKTKEAAEIRRTTEEDVRKRLDEERQLIEDHKKKREIEKVKEDANKQLNLRERVDARLKRHKEAHSADLLKLHFERGRRRDLEKKELRRRQADNEREREAK